MEGLDDLIIFVIFMLIAGISALYNKVRTTQERKRLEDELQIDPDELPEATRRMLYGEPRAGQPRRPAYLDSEDGVNPEEDDADEEGVDTERAPQPARRITTSAPPQRRVVAQPIASEPRRGPVAQQAPPERRMPVDRPSTIRPAQAPPRRETAPPMPPTVRPMQHQPAQPPRVPPPMARQPQIDPRVLEERERVRRERELAQQLKRQQQAAAQAQQRAAQIRGRGRRDAKRVLQRMLSNRTALGYSVLLSEILAPPKALRSVDSEKRW